MGWEKRGGKFYYYQKRRRGRRVVSEYVGAGESAYLISILEEEEFLEKKHTRAQWHKQRGELAKISEDVDQFAKIVNGCVRAVLLTSGYHPHKGQWRRKRNG